MQEAKAAHETALKDQEELKIAIEEERKAKEEAEKLSQEMSVVCSSLRHKTLAFAMQRAKEARLTKEAQDASEKL